MRANKIPPPPLLAQVVSGGSDLLSRRKKEGKSKVAEPTPEAIKVSSLKGPLGQVDLRASVKLTEPRSS